MPYKKKIFDIVPPQSIPFQPSSIQEQKKSSLSSGKTGKSAKRKAQAATVALITVLVLIYLLIETRAEIEIWPVRDFKDFETRLEVDGATEEIRQNKKNVIPGEIMLAEKLVSQEFSSSGVKLKETKASGTIRVYNAFSTSPRVLVPSRFVSADGKLFWSVNRIKIPGKRYEEGKLIPGEIDVKVRAAKPGKEYNIGPSTFALPALAGSPSFTAIYGKSFEPMTGGQIVETLEVTEEDLEAAQRILSEQAMEESRISLENLVSLENHIIIEEAVTKEIIEVTPLAEKGQEIDRFFFQVKAVARALVFKKSDLENFAAAYIRSKISPQKELQENSLNVKYSAEAVNLEKEKIILNVEMSAKIYSTIDENSLMEAIKNKTMNEIRGLLKKFPEIDKIQVRFWPFWVTRAPQDSERIEIKLMLEGISGDVGDGVGDVD